MGMDVRMATRIKDPYLTLAQWFSPLFPLGGFAYSHGLEWAIEAGHVRDTGTLEAWILDVLRNGSGHSDCLLLAAAYFASDEDLTGIDATARAFASSKERLLETTQQGAAFCETAAAVHGIDLPALTLPVGVGRAAQLCDLPLDITQQMYLKAFAANLVSVGMRLIPLGQTQGQILIDKLIPLCIETAKRSVSGDLTALSNTAFLSEIDAMKHETQHSRIFRT